MTVRGGQVRQLVPDPRPARAAVTVVVVVPLLTAAVTVVVLLAHSALAFDKRGRTANDGGRSPYYVRHIAHTVLPLADHRITLGEHCRHIKPGGLRGSRP